MNNNILTKIVIACLCCCTMLVAKTHIDDQVDPSILEKIAVEAQAAEALQEPAKSPKVERKNVIKVLKQERQYEIFVPTYNPNEGVDKEALILVPNTVHSSIENATTSQDKIDWIEAQNALHGFSNISDWTDEDYTQNLTGDKAAAFGTNVYIPNGRDADHTFTACADGYASEGSWQVYSYADGGFLTDVMFFTENYGCMDFTATLAPGTYSFEFYDSYGDGAISSYSLDGVELGSWTGWGLGTYAFFDVELSDPTTTTCDDEAACNTGEVGDCTYPSAGFDCDGNCADTSTSAVTFNLVDSYGDGWNGGSITFGGDVLTIDAGDAASFTYCLADADYSYSYTAGSWASENSWTVDTADATISGGFGADGSADYNFTVGGAPPAAGCMDACATNHDADAAVDDGSCTYDNTGMCFDNVCYNFDLDLDGYVDIDSLCDYYMLYEWYFGYSCADIISFGYDCSNADSCGSDCPAAPECGDGECNGDETYDTCADDCDAPEACAEGEAAYTIVVGGGSYDSEMGWSLDDADGNRLYTAGCDYPNYYGICEGGGNGTFDLCLSDDAFFSIYGYDSYGDGWNGGYWEIFDADGNSAAGGPEYTVTNDNYYGWGWGWGFCLGAGCGCTFEGAENYDSNATVEDWTCDLAPGSDCSYWGDEYIGFEAGCGGVHCYADYQGELGNGSCNAHACGGDDPWCHGMACAHFACDGGDCSQGDDADGECYEAPATCEDTECVLEMVDSFGDSWNGNVWVSGDQNAANDGSTGGDPQYADLCFDMSAANVYSCDGGSWQGEVSWTLTCGDTVVASGGAPADGCFGDCNSVVYGCTDMAACNYNADATDDDGSCIGPDCAGDCDGSAVVDACGECNGDGSACAGCAWANYYADSYCDPSNNTAECNYDGGDCCPGDCLDPGANDPNDYYDCATNGGDCFDCADPGSADNAEGGECYSLVAGCTDLYADNFNPDATDDDGSCLYDGCALGATLGCSDQDIADGDCAADGWVGDGYCDGYAEAYGVNFCCYDNDGGDCTDAECAAPADWNASITGLTAYDSFYGTTPAITWDWDDLSDGTSCEDNGQVTCEFDGSCADTADDCAGNPYPDCLGTLSWIGDGYCDGGNNNAECGFDAGDCCPTECADDAANNCPDNPAGCYSNCADGTCCGDCGTCIDPDDGDLAAGGACEDYEVWTDAQCAATFAVTGSTDIDADGISDDCYTDGSAYFYFTWEGGCTLSGMLDWETGEYEDMSAYGFNGGFYYYGFDLGSAIDWVVFFGEEVTSSGLVTVDCVAAP